MSGVPILNDRRLYLKLATMYKIVHDLLVFCFRIKASENIALNHLNHLISLDHY